VGAGSSRSHGEHLVPQKQLREAVRALREALPIAHAIVKELKKYPDVDLVEVVDGKQTRANPNAHGKLAD